MELIAVWLLLAFVIERLVEVIVKLMPFLKQLNIQEVNIEMFLALAASLVIAFGTELDFFKIFTIEFQYPYVGNVLSALFMSAGSNVVHDIIEWIRATKESAKL